MTRRNQVQYWVGIALYVVLTRLEDMENDIMATLADLIQDDTDLQAEVATIGNDVATALARLADVEAQLAALQSGELTPEQQAQVDQLASDLTAAKDALTNTDASIQSAVNPPAPEG